MFTITEYNLQILNENEKKNITHLTLENWKPEKNAKNRKKLEFI